MTSSLEFRDVARRILAMAMEMARSRAAVLFEFNDKPLMLVSLASSGFVKFPEDVVIPLLPRHGYALNRLRSPLRLDAEKRAQLFSIDGNFNPSLIEWIIPLRMGRKLVGLFGLGETWRRRSTPPRSCMRWKWSRTIAPWRCTIITFRKRWRRASART